MAFYAASNGDSYAQTWCHAVRYYVALAPQSHVDLLYAQTHLQIALYLAKNNHSQRQDYPLANHIAVQLQNPLDHDLAQYVQRLYQTQS